MFQNLDILRRHDPRIVLVLAGDHVYKMDYTRMIDEHVARRADMTVGCVEVPVAEATQMGVMEVDDNYQVLGFEEKPAAPRPLPGRNDLALGSMGIYVFNAPFLYAQLIRDAQDPDSAHDFGHNLIPYLVAEGYRVSCAPSQRQLHATQRRAAVLARRRHDRRLLGSQHGVDARKPGARLIR